IGFARAASMDIALTASFSIAMLAWWAWRESQSRAYLAAFYAALAFGLLAKGPVAPLLAILVIVIFSIFAGNWKLVMKTLWLPGVLLFLVVASPWYIAVQARNAEFFRVFILEHNFGRFSSDLYHHRQPFWYYARVVLLALVPWAAFVGLSLVQTVQAWWA